MAACTAPAAKAALLTLLDARTGLNGVQVVWTFPGDKAERQYLCFGDTELNEVAGQLGNGTRHESYTINVWVSVHWPSNDPQDAEERAWAIVAELEAQLKPPNNADLGIAGANGIKSLTAQFAGGTLATYPELEGQTAQGSFRVAVEARI